MNRINLDVDDIVSEMSAIDAALQTESSYPSISSSMAAASSLSSCFDAGDPISVHCKHSAAPMQEDAVP